MEATFNIADLNLWYGTHHALNDICMDIPPNQVTALIGPSGCGKSTFLKTLNRMQDLVDGVRIEGKVLFKGQDIYAPKTDVTELRKRVGMVFQKANPFPMSIYDNVAYGPRVHGVRNRDELDRIVEESLRGAALWDEVKDRLRAPAVRLSIGQQQRLCLARSLAVEPEFILADEATSALDPVSSRTVEDLFVKLKEQYSIIMVTHTLRQAMRIADYVVFIYLGEIIECGDAKEVFKNPKHDLTKKYLQGAFS
jgi:phosphate transport system ATP-binding protein